MRHLKYLAFLLVIISHTAMSQDVYLKKITALTNKQTVTKTLMEQLDSLKQTRRPKDSYVNITFKRSVDFDFNHYRIDIQLNEFNYHINLLTKNDTIYFSSVLYGNSIFNGDVPDEWNKSRPVKLDSLHVLKFLKQRNNFYKSHKTISNLVEEINLNNQYSLNCGDGNTETKEFKEIKALAKKNESKKFRQLLNSINCEEQAYGVLGYREILKNKFPVPKEVQKLLTHIKQRKDMLVQCNGCFVTVK